MTTYLLTWKPDEWGYEDLKERIVQFEGGETLQRWSCGNSKKILSGSRIFLMKQGKGTGGIFGSGVVAKEPFNAPHYNQEKRAAGKEALYIMVDFDQLYDPERNITITREELKSLDEKLWKSQGSGKRIEDDLAVQLEKIWLERTGGAGIPYPEELASEEKYIEGSRKQVTVNAYERDPAAREKCIRKWGASCSVCGFHFEYFYGSIGKNYIHVHHLKPLSEIGEEYEVDPVNDLRSVCPNCHSMPHRRKPVLSIEELRSLVSIYGQRVGS